MPTQGPVRVSPLTALPKDQKVPCRDAEPELEPPEPTHFGRSRSRSRRNGLLGAGTGAVKNGVAPAPKRDTIVARKKQRRNNKKQPNKKIA